MDFLEILYKEKQVILTLFEKLIAKYTGAPYAVAVDCCSHAIFLCLKYLNEPQEITIPKNTYISIPMQCIHAGYNIKFDDIKWTGEYQLYPLNIYDSARRFTKNMYRDGTFQCLSFGIGKTLDLVKGGMILTDNKEAFHWFKRMRNDGRYDEIENWREKGIPYIGYKMNMPLETAMKGILKFEDKKNSDNGGYELFPDISEYECWK